MNILRISRKAMQPSNSGTGIPVIQLGKFGRGSLRGRFFTCVQAAQAGTSRHEFGFFTRAQALAVGTSHAQ